MPSTKVLITGGTGFLGSEIVKVLVEAKDFAITALDINPPSLGTESYSSVTYVRCDILNFKKLREVFKEARPTVVLHTVAVNLLGESRYSTQGKDTVFTINVDGTKNVIQASQEFGVKAFVYTSSVTVLLDQLEENFRNADETWSTGRATTLYGQSKTMAEGVVLSSNTPSFRTCALRAAPIFGPRDPVTIPTIYGCIANGETPFILGSGNNLQDYVYVSNVADAHVLALHNLLGLGIAAGEAFFITNGEPITVRDLCLAVWKEFGHYPLFQLRIPEELAWWMGWGLEWASWLTSRKGTFSRGVVLDATKTRYVSISKARRVLGYIPRVSLPEALQISCQVSPRIECV
ncbi:C-3 sterol dehydrogenase/C-4 decarboxylase-like protein [Karstenula rhodostoma CBS 690.94]|uniref:C-3 sterol dehydrogenase/C-4 decarboxylase-like protein n=1 Tax=Karstenula rhodostoma CBS 690.94 TaxID=1392251 RepID=A0A9P4PDH1_9PLEO|nr:C-3 sterol dehydrogenase/C-4 decarboxylase-like protein [Karstenula rhodostoma CBS 690.94]